MKNRFFLILGVACLLLTSSVVARAQEDGTAQLEPAAVEEPDGGAAKANGEELKSFFATTTVTATGNAEDSFEVSTPVTVLEIETIESRMPDNAADLLREEPGVDVNGIGPNQSRPVIRGQRGLRVLFLENGLRMNNARRQTDFGETPGLVDLDSLQSVEVVRGPASVLYGSDAIGGVLNLVTRMPAYGQAGWGGSFDARYGSAGDSTRAGGSVDGRFDKYALRAGLSLRDAGDYDAASGSFGLIDLDDEVRVVDSGVEDDSLYGHLGIKSSDSSEWSLRWNRYRADQSGFGFVEPELIGEDETFRIRILYPFQDFDRYTVSYVGAGLESSVADSVEVQAYFQNNERQLANDIDINIGPLAPVPGWPDSTVEADTLNFTDLETFGTRAEAVKIVEQKHIVTYGLEYFEDDSFNTDSSTTTTTLRFLGPPFEIVDVQTDTVPNAPNANNRSYGLFAQGEFELGSDVKVTAGARYQNVETKAEATPGWDVTGLDFSDDNVVGAVSILYRVDENLRIVGGYGTAFRAPNIVERLFNGLTPEGIGFQVLNPDLVSETSENLDLGLKYRRRNAFMEVALFQNTIDDGIIQYFLTPEEQAQLPQETRDEIAGAGVTNVVQQRNIDRLRYEGVELVIGWRSERGLTLGGNYTYLDGKRIDSTNPPTGDTVSNKINAFARWEPVESRWWLEYRLRHNGDERANLDVGSPIPPVGEILPSFTVHTLSGAVKLFERDRQRHELGIVIDNLTDELYAEFSNATFFRPEAKRNVMLTYRFRS
jgi:hemoglobin/transferrin/lactoferrin receptor protein